MLQHDFITSHYLLFLLTFIIILLSLSPICIGHSNAVTEQQQSSITTPIAVVPLIMQNLLTLICFLFLACYFVVGLRIQSAARTTTESTSQSSSPSHRSVIDEYFLVLILSSLVPALIVTIYGIVLIYSYISGSLHATFGNHVYVSYVEGNYSYLLLLFVCFIPAGAVLFLLKKLHSFDNKN